MFLDYMQVFLKCTKFSNDIRSSIHCISIQEVHFLLLLKIHVDTLCSYAYTQLQADTNVQEFVLELLEETKLYEDNKKAS